MKLPKKLSPLVTSLHIQKFSHSGLLMSFSLTSFTLYELIVRYLKI